MNRQDIAARICVHILSYMVGIKDGKLSVLTDDKGALGKIVVMGTTAFDLSVDDKISMTSRELVQKIMEPNGINIVF